MAKIYHWILFTLFTPNFRTQILSIIKISIGKGSQSRFIQPCNLSFIPFWLIITIEEIIKPDKVTRLIAKNTVFDVFDDYMDQVHYRPGEKAAIFLYFVVKNHSFSGVNKGILAQVSAVPLIGFIVAKSNNK